MASAQCCNQGHDQKPSLRQKVSEMASWAFKKEDSRHGHTAAQTHTQTKTGHSLGQANNAQNFTSGKARNGKNKKKKGLFEKIKDGISGHSDSGSSSESDSDDNKCERKKGSLVKTPSLLS